MIKFVHLKHGTSGQLIADAIKDELRDIDLNLDQCRGQGYDGAGNMSGKYIGAAKVFQDEFPQAIYVHCASLRLNLCVANSCKIPIVKNLFSVMKRVHDFLNWPKRQNILVTTLKDVNPDAKQLKLLDVCKTRWVERIDSLRIFESLFEGIVVTLEKIKDNIDGTRSSDAIVDAAGLFAALSSFHFVISLVVTQKALGHTRSATILLQDRAMDIVNGYREINILKHAIHDVRDNVEKHHREWYLKAQGIAEKIGTKP